jgi:hypothetical protein
MNVSQKLRMLETVGRVFPMWALQRQANVIYRAFDGEVAKAKASGDRNEYEKVISTLYFEVGEYTDKLRALRSRALLAQAARFYVHVPDLKWEHGQWSWDGFLAEESEALLYQAIQQQKIARREFQLKLLTAGTGIVGALIG